jgi:hypothetical protein
MATKQKDKSSNKPKPRSRKAERPSQKLDQVQSPKLDPEIEEQIVPRVAANEAVAIEEAFAIDEAAPAEFSAEFLPSEMSAPAEPASTIEVTPTELTTAEAIPAMSPPMELASAVELVSPEAEKAATTDQASVGFQSIANAYRSYANKSLEQTGSFVEKLMGVRSFDKAAEVQIEFARQAYANLISESQNICQLYSRWTGQMFRSWPGIAIGVPAK